MKDSLIKLKVSQLQQKQFQKKSWNHIKGCLTSTSRVT